VAKGLKLKKEMLHVPDTPSNASLEIKIPPKKTLEIKFGELENIQANLQFRMNGLKEKIKRDKDRQITTKMDLFVLGLLNHKKNDIDYLIMQSKL